MNCELCHDLIQQRLDGQNVVAPELERHLAECTRCASLESASQRLRAGLQLLVSPRPPLDLTERFVAGGLADLRTQRQRVRRRFVAVAVAASLLVAAAGIGWYVSERLGFNKDQPQVPIIVNNTPTLPRQSPDQQKPPSTPSMRDSVTDAGNALASLTTRTADETVGQTRLLVPMVTGPSLDELDMPPGVESTKSYLETSHGVSTALEPVTNSAGRALRLFSHDLPTVGRVSNPQ